MQFVLTMLLFWWLLLGLWFTMIHPDVFIILFVFIFPIAQELLRSHSLRRYRSWPVMVLVCVCLFFAFCSPDGTCIIAQYIFNIYIYVYIYIQSYTHVIPCWWSASWQLRMLSWHVVNHPSNGKAGKKYNLRRPIILKVIWQMHVLCLPAAGQSQQFTSNSNVNGDDKRTRGNYEQQRHK